MTIFGYDASHFDPIDCYRALEDPALVFMTHKIGGDSDDQRAAAWWSGAKNYRQAGKLLGGYWVLYPGNPRGRAEAFINRLDAVCSGWRNGPFLLQVDCEKWNGNAGTVPSVADMNAFCDRLAELAPKLRAIAYAPDWVYGDLSRLRYPTWASAYVSPTGQSYRSLYPGDTSGKWKAYGGKTPVILQYSSNARFANVNRLGDANAFRGTLDDLISLAAPGWKDDDMPLTDQDKKDIAREVWAVQFPSPYVNEKDGSPAQKAVSDYQRYTPSASWHQTTQSMIASLAASVSADAADKDKALANLQSVLTTLAPTLVTAVLAALPNTELTQEQVSQAFEDALRKAFGSQGN